MGLFRRTVVALSAVLLLSSCAHKGTPLLPESEADARWQAFVSMSEKSPSYDTLSGSLRFGPVNDTRRVTYTMWSAPDAGGIPSSPPSSHASEQKDARAIRLEVDAGIGVNIAKGLFSHGRMLMVLPKERKAYVGDASPENLNRLLGLSLPMGMERMNEFLAGRFLYALDAPHPERYESKKDGGILYHYRSDKGKGAIVLDEKARPVRWISPDAWEMDISFDDKSLPRKIDGKGNSAEGLFRMVLLVKDRQESAKTSGLTLEVPPDSIVYSFDR